MHQKKKTINLIKIPPKTKGKSLGILKMKIKKISFFQIQSNFYASFKLPNQQKEETEETKKENIILENEASLKFNIVVSLIQFLQYLDQIGSILIKIFDKNSHLLIGKTFLNIKKILLENQPEKELEISNNSNQVIGSLIISIKISHLELGDDIQKSRNEKNQERNESHINNKSLRELLLKINQLQEDVNTSIVNTNFEENYPSNFTQNSSNSKIPLLENHQKEKSRKSKNSYSQNSLQNINDSLVQNPLFLTRIFY
ncbi:hypothetical protein M0811_01355 [Anaeramoeba ignava]|uniref:C2CD3 N-terminal C2 domain-containing protein n=1 Tax=Anaeramoeba ignava TaxID=1746090 RepID=A0A9Q0R9W0_ANAIG|nr:hypothetical protein M0811_01355 [Anaeramoeba ignava]